MTEQSKTNKINSFMNSIISVENLSKQYRIGTRLPYKSLRETIMNVVTSPARLFKRNGSGENNTIWALKDVSFEVKQGEVLGIIGRNGAGKTTLLKILSRVTEPTDGEVKIRGRVGSLLEVGTGFHPELTGRENIFLNGAILGMRKEEIEKKFDEIVAFAEVEKFLDTPMKRYSSGMYVRLAFAVAAHLEPEILLVDEVLAVGDAQFQKKCLGKMGEVAREGRTVLFVSHNMAAVNRLCRQAMWLDEGRLQMTGTAESVVAAYLSAGAEVEGERRWENLEEAPGNEKIRLRAVRILNSTGEISSIVDIRYPFYFEIEYDVFVPLFNLQLGYQLQTLDGIVILSTGDIEDEGWEKKRNEPGSYISRCEVPGMFLNSMSYTINVGANIPSIEIFFHEEGVLKFDVVQTGNVLLQHYRSLPGVICPRLRWSISKKPERQS
jgi:lipopolysaccharide transport system ATP-binding protein